MRMGMLKGGVVTFFMLILALGAFAPRASAAGPNLVPNSTLETTAGSLPQGWKKGGYGTNARTLTYPVTGVGGGRAVKTQIQSYTSGDAKWYFDPIAVSSGVYTYRDQYMSDRESILTVEFRHTNGSRSYKDIAFLPAAASWMPAAAEFTVPAGVASATVFHLIKGVGSLTLDNVEVRFKEGMSGIFSTGAVTLRFDDGWLSQYQNALPKLSSSGFKGTFYIVTRQMAENGFPGYISRSELQNIYAAGHEVGAHTRTHRDLTALSSSDRQAEIAGSRQDLLSWNVGPIRSFSVPFGAYNSSIISLVQSAGFSSMATSDGQSMNQPTSDPYRLTRFPITSGTSVASVKQAIDQAAANKEWLIISFHEVNTSGRAYAITPSNFNQIVDYLVQKGIPVITVSEGAAQLQ